MPEYMLRVADSLFCSGEFAIDFGVALCRAWFAACSFTRVYACARARACFVRWKTKEIDGIKKEVNKKLPNLTAALRKELVSWQKEEGFPFRWVSFRRFFRCVSCGWGGGVTFNLDHSLLSARICFCCPSMGEVFEVRFANCVPGARTAGGVAALFA